MSSKQPCALNPKSAEGVSGDSHSAEQEANVTRGEAASNDVQALGPSTSQNVPKDSQEVNISRKYTNDSDERSLGTRLGTILSEVQLSVVEMRTRPSGTCSGCPHCAAAPDDGKVSLLQLKRGHHDVIKSERKQWEARFLVNDNNGSRMPSLPNRLAIVGRIVVLQSKADTNDRVRIADALRYVLQGHSYPLEKKISDLGAALLPDVVDRKEY